MGRDTLLEDVLRPPPGWSLRGELEWEPCLQCNVQSKVGDGFGMYCDDCLQAMADAYWACHMTDEPCAGFCLGLEWAAVEWDEPYPWEVAMDRLPWWRRPDAQKNGSAHSESSGQQERGR